MSWVEADTLAIAAMSYISHRNSAATESRIGKRPCCCIDTQDPIVTLTSYSPLTVFPYGTWKRLKCAMLCPESAYDDLPGLTQDFLIESSISTARCHRIIFCDSSTADRNFKSFSDTCTEFHCFEA